MRAAAAPTRPRARRDAHMHFPHGPRIRLMQTRMGHECRYQRAVAGEDTGSSSEWEEDGCAGGRGAGGPVSVCVGG